MQTLQEIHIEQIEHEHGDHGEALDGKYDENLCHFVLVIQPWSYWSNLQN